MANNIIKRVWNQNKMVNIEALQGMAFQAEDGGHTFEISGIDDTGATVSLTGTVAGVFRRPDNADIALTGAASDGKVSVTLTEDCYAVPGRFALTIFVTADSKKTAVYAAVGTVASTSGGAVAGSTPQDVVDLINAIAAAVATIPADYTDLMAAIAPIYSNSALYAVGSYAWNAGGLYRCTTPITTPESWTAAHWTAAALGVDVADLKSAFGNYQVFAATENGAFAFSCTSGKKYIARVLSGTIALYTRITSSGSNAQEIMKSGSTAGEFAVFTASFNTAYIYVVTSGDASFIVGYYDSIAVLPLANNDNIGKIQAGLDHLYSTGKQYIQIGDVFGLKSNFVPVNMTAGVARFTCTSITSTDTDASTCLVVFMHGATTITSLLASRGVAISQDVNLTQACDGIYFYSSDTGAHSNDDTFVFSGVGLEKPITDTTLAVSGKYADAKATGDRIQSVYDAMPENMDLYVFSATHFLTIGAFLKKNGTTTAFDGYRCSDFIKVESGQVIKYGLKMPSTNAVLCFYASNSESSFVSNAYVSGTGDFDEGTYTAPSAGFIRVCTTNDSQLVDAYCYTQIKPNKNFITSAESKLNVLLLGDSIFGNDGEIRTFINRQCNFCVNGAFGGTRVSVRDGNDDFKYFDGVNIVTALTTQTWTDQDAAAERMSSTYTWIPTRLAVLKAVDMSQIDLIIMDWGTNDYTAAQSIETITTAFATVIDILQTAFPAVRILISTPIWRYFGTVADNENGDNKTYFTGGPTLKEIATAIEQTMHDKRISVLNAYQNMPLSYATASTYYDSGDTTHLNIKGNEVYAGLLVGKMRTMFL